MKTKNNLTTGIIIGICVIVLPLILMSTSYTTEKKNTYEFHGHHSGTLLNTVTGETWFIFEKNKVKHEEIKSNKKEK